MLFVLSSCIAILCVLSGCTAIFFVLRLYIVCIEGVYCHVSSG